MKKGIKILATVGILAMTTLVGTIPVHAVNWSPNMSDEEFLRVYGATREEIDYRIMLYENYGGEAVAARDKEYSEMQAMQNVQEYAPVAAVDTSQNDNKGSAKYILDKFGGYAEKGKGYKWTEGYLFDEAKYAAENPDVVAVYGTSHDALWNHYKSYGVYEGRNAYCKEIKYNGSTMNAGTCRDMEMLSALKTICTPQMSDREKVIAVNNWLCDYMSYGPSMTDKHVGPCADYAGSFKTAMNALGIPCATDGNIEHIWNKVKIDGQWLVVDVTWNDSTGTNDWLLVSNH